VTTHKRTDAYGAVDMIAYTEDEDWWINTCGWDEDIKRHKKKVMENEHVLRWLSGRTGRRFFLFGFRQDARKGSRAEKKIVELVYKGPGKTESNYSWIQIYPEDAMSTLFEAAM